MRIERVNFLIDGFNLYHSVRRAGRDLGGATTKWLDIRSICSSYLYILRKTARLTQVYYFSALANHLKVTRPDVIQRHIAFIECLQSTGIVVELGRFKEKTMYCSNCNHQTIRHEEKETDVAISIKLLELFFTDACDIAVLVTGDTDLAPAVRRVQALFPGKKVLFAFPYQRQNRELARLAPGSFNIRKEHYTRHQFPDPVTLPDGRQIRKPASW